jgi:predicted nicotinamide N-methyase
MNTLEEFQTAYEATERELNIGDRPYRFLVPQGIDCFINGDDPMHNFPLWAKIWKASLALADHLSGMSKKGAGSILEIGAGLGVAGIVAASRGHRVTLTEYDEDALAFARANAAINGCRDLNVRRLDWHMPDFMEPFDTIAGSEVLYHERDFDALLNLFTIFLKPGGHVILSMKPRRSAMMFLERVRETFDIGMKKIEMTATDEYTRCVSMPHAKKKPTLDETEDNANMMRCR